MPLANKRQLRILESVYAQEKWPKRPLVSVISKETNLEICWIFQWFHRARKRERMLEARGITDYGVIDEASISDAVQRALGASTKTPVSAAKPEDRYTRVSSAKKKEKKQKKEKRQKKEKVLEVQRPSRTRASPSLVQIAKDKDPDGAATRYKVQSSVGSHEDQMKASLQTSLIGPAAPGFPVVLSSSQDSAATSPVTTEPHLPLVTALVGPAAPAVPVISAVRPIQTDPLQPASQPPGMPKDEIMPHACICNLNRPPPTDTVAIYASAVGQMAPTSSPAYPSPSLGKKMTTFPPMFNPTLPQNFVEQTVQNTDHLTNAFQTSQKSSDFAATLNKIISNPYSGTQVPAAWSQAVANAQAQRLANFNLFPPAPAGPPPNSFPGYQPDAIFPSSSLDASLPLFCNQLWPQTSAGLDYGYLPQNWAALQLAFDDWLQPAGSRLFY